jgi:hypothetical protein
MFPPATTRPGKRSLRAMVSGAVFTAIEFATLGEAHAPAPVEPVSTGHRTLAAAPTATHPHRRSLGRTPRARRQGTVPARTQVCTSPVHPHRPASRA